MYNSLRSPVSTLYYTPCCNLSRDDEDFAPSKVPPVRPPTRVNHQRVENGATRISIVSREISPPPPQYLRHLAHSPISQPQIFTDRPELIINSRVTLSPWFPPHYINPFQLPRSLQLFWNCSSTIRSTPSPFFSTFNCIFNHPILKLQIIRYIHVT